MYYFVILFSMILITLYNIISDLFSRNYPPGPARYPVIGSLLSFPAREIEKKIPGWRKKYGNVIGHRLFGHSVIIITGYSEITSAMKNNNFQARFSTLHPILQPFFKVYGFFAADGEQWSEVRRFTLRYLGQISKIQFEHVMHDEIMNFFASIKSGEIYEVNNKFLDFAINSISTILLGDVKKRYSTEINVIREDTNRAFKSGRATGYENFNIYLRALFIAGLAARIVKYGDRFFQKVVEEHRASFDEDNIRDYVDAFLIQQKKEKETLGTDFYSDKELFACLSDMIRTAGESSGNTEGFLLLYVAMYPEVQKKIHEELDQALEGRLPRLDDKNRLPYCEAVIYETIRINCIAPISVPHIATETTPFCGYTIPKGCTIIFALRDIFMNPDVFEEPEVFKPERFLAKEMKSKVIAFGLGKRACIGEVVAKNTLFLFTAYFFQKYIISLPKGHENPSTEAKPGFTTSPCPFKVIIDERN